MPRKRANKSEQQLEEREPELRLFPHELLPGDVFRDADGTEWTVVHAPATYREGKRVTVKFGRPGEPASELVLDLAAHEKVTVRRPT